jgi:hypothetical protein
MACSVLSTSAPARSIGVEQSVVRRRTCDRRIWTKPLASAADAEGYKYIVWVFNGRFAISSPKPAQMPVFFEPKCSSPSEYYHPLSSARRNPDRAQKPPTEHAQASAAQRLRPNEEDAS